MRAALLALVALGSIACEPRSLGPRTARRIATVSGERRILTLTDLEEVRDVAVAGGASWAATDDGVLVWQGEDEPRRIGREQGLPSEDVLAIALEADGTALAATANGLVSISGSTASVIENVPPHARPMDLAIQGETAWLCTLSGMLVRRAGTWARFGDPIACTTLAPTPEGQLWIGTTQGIQYVEGDVVREHAVGQGIPENYVRAIVPVLPGQILAIVSGPSSSQLAFWDGARWYGYTLPGLEEPVVGLMMRSGDDATLVTRDRAFAIAPSGGGASFRAVHAQDGNVRSFRAASSTDATPVPEVDIARTIRAPSAFSSIDGRGPAPQAPGLVAIPLANELPSRMYRALQSGEHAFVAIANAGLLEVPRLGEPRALRSRSLVPEADLQVATETQGGVWVRARDGDIAKWVDGRLRRLQLPAEIAPQAIASGPEGAYLAALVRGTRTVRIFTSVSGQFRQLLERELEAPVVRIPLIGVAPSGRIWMAIDIERESGGGSLRTRGVAVIDPASETVLYHHRAAPQGQGLRMPDEVSALTFDADGHAWLATLGGAVRVEEHQAIVFDETRGVRGEVVTDVASGSAQMWIAAAEGLGSYADRQFDFTQPPIVTQHRPVALATDSHGHLWGAGNAGILHHDGREWRHLGTADGLPSERWLDVEVDGAGRVWLLSTEAVVVLAPARD